MSVPRTPPLWIGLAAVLLSAVTYGQEPGPAFSFLKVQGTDIVDEGGAKVDLDGVNLNCWLVWEGGGYGFPSLSESQTRDELVKKVPSEKVDLFFRLLREEFVQREDFARIKALGLNFVRLPIHHKFVREQESKLLDDGVRWAKEAGLYVLLDLHAAPGGQSSSAYADTRGEARLWTDAPCREEYFRALETLARRYRDEPAVAGYELLNEPVTEDTPALVSLYEEGLRRVRAIDPRHIVFLDGNHFAMDFEVFAKPFGENTVYVFHTYEGQDKAKKRFATYDAFRAKFDVPLMCNEYDNPAYTRFFREQNISRARWVFKKWDGQLMNPYYTTPPDHPWRKWIEGVRAQMKADEPALQKEVVGRIERSSLPPEFKRTLMQDLDIAKLLENPGAAKQWVAALVEKTTLNRAALQELKRIGDELMALSLPYLARDLKEMSEADLRKLTQSLRTGSWIRAGE